MKRGTCSARLLIRGVAALGLLLLFGVALTTASAHSADMYIENQSLVLTSGELEVDWRITPGPLLAGAVWNAADRNNDGAVSPDEAGPGSGPFWPDGW